MARKKTEQEIYKGRAGPERVQQIMQERGVSEARAKQIARGHGTTPEHGKPPREVPFYETEEHGQIVHRSLHDTRSGQLAKHILVSASREGQKVSIEVFDKEHTQRPLIYTLANSPHTTYGSRHDARWLLYDKSNPDRIGGIRNLKKWLEKQQMPESGHPSPGYFPKGITRIRITRFS